MNPISAIAEDSFPHHSNHPAVAGGACAGAARIGTEHQKQEKEHFRPRLVIVVSSLTLC